MEITTRRFYKNMQSPQHPHGNLHYLCFSHTKIRFSHDAAHMDYVRGPVVQSIVCLMRRLRGQ